MIANSNTLQQMHVRAKMTSLGLKFLVNYQIKQLGQSQSKEKISSLISLFIKATTPFMQGRDEPAPNSFPA
jgi:hypothetical protein